METPLLIFTNKDFEDVYSEMHTFGVIRDSAWQWYTRETFE